MCLYFSWLGAEFPGNKNREINLDNREFAGVSREFYDGTGNSVSALGSLVALIAMGWRIGLFDHAGSCLQCADYPVCCQHLMNRLLGVHRGGFWLIVTTME